MMTRLILSVACILLLVDYAFAQTAAAPESNLYLRALSACVEKQAGSYKNLGLERDYLNRIVEHDTFLTDKLPVQLGEYRIEYLNRDELITRYKRLHKPFPILSMRPMMNEDGKLKISLGDYWISYGKRTLSYGLEGGCNVWFRYDCEQKTHVIDKVDVWGV